MDYVLDIGCVFRSEQDASLSPGQDAPYKRSASREQDATHMPGRMPGELVGQGCPHKRFGPLPETSPALEGARFKAKLPFGEKDIGRMPSVMEVV